MMLMPWLLAGAALAAPELSVDARIERAANDILGARVGRAEASLQGVLSEDLTPRQRCQATDLMAQVHVFANRYFQGLEAMREAIQIGACERLSSAEHPVVHVAKLHACAVEAVGAGLSSAALEHEVRVALGASSTADLDQALLAAMEEGAWRCPVAVRPSPPPLTVVERRVVPEPQPPPVLDLEAHPPEAESRLRPYAFASGGLALAAGATAAALGVVAGQMADHANDPATYAQDMERAERFAVGANVAWGVAGAAAVTAVLVWVLDGPG